MKKSVWITLLTIILAIAIIAIVLKMYDNKKTTIQSKAENTVEISSHKITDDCLKEFEEENVESANSNIEENEKFILRNTDGYVCVYLVKDKKENLYKITEISIDYLTEEDVENLEKGIEVEGTENLNKLLEDFE